MAAADPISGTPRPIRRPSAPAALSEASQGNQVPGTPTLPIEAVMASLRVNVSTKETPRARARRTEITPRGASQLRTSDTALDTVEHELFADLSERDLATLRRLLGKLRTSPQDFSCTEE